MERKLMPCLVRVLTFRDAGFILSSWNEVGPNTTIPYPPALFRDPVTSDSSPDAITDLVTALHMYLEDVHGYCTVCIRHATVAAIRQQGEAWLVRWRYPWSRSLIKFLRTASRELPGPRVSPFFKSERHRWAEIVREMSNRKKRPAVHRAVSFERMPFCIRVDREHSWLYVDLLLLPVRRGPLEHPLCVLGRALRCREYLLPVQIASPTAVAKWLPPGWVSVEEYMAAVQPHRQP
jgi:hypothetical protein